MAIGMAAIGQLSNSSLRSGLYFERHLAEIETARKIVAGLPDRKDLPDGSLSGVLDSHKWRIDAAPFPNTLAPVDVVSDWRPQMLVLHVVAPSGSVVEIDTIRLSRRASQ
jgi:hypothetical protein